MPEITKSRENWLRMPDADRPIYQCPKCGEKAMQYFHLLAETAKNPERNESFVCFACGASWQQ